MPRYLCGALKIYLSANEPSYLSGTVCLHIKGGLIFIDKKTVLIGIISIIIIFAVGICVGNVYFSKETTIEKEKTIEVKGETKTITETQIAYVPKETIIVKYIDQVTGQEVTEQRLEKTDIDAQIGKQEVNVRLNSKEVSFQKSDDEQFVFEKNKIALNQSSTVTFDVKVEPNVINKTKRWSIGAGVGSNGLAGKIDFPIGNSESFGGWIYGDKKTGAAGIAIKF